MVVVLWLILFVLSWPLAVAALLLYPVLWLLLLPLRLFGVAVGGVFALVIGVVKLPFRVLAKITP